MSAFDEGGKRPAPPEKGADQKGRGAQQPTFHEEMRVYREHFFTKFREDRAAPVRQWGDWQDNKRAAREQEAARIAAKRDGQGSSVAPRQPAAQGGGTPLSADVRGRMEPALGADLSSVRVHTGGDAAARAKGYGAKAYAEGQDVHFASGQYQPGTKEGDRLLAHELVHTVQANKSGAVARKADEDHGHEGDHGGVEVSQPHEPAEQEADAVADKVVGRLHDNKDPGKASASDAKGAAKADAHGDKAAAAPKQAPVAPISAKLDGVGTKLWRAADDENVKGELKNIFPNKRAAPNWPAAFKPKTPNGTTRNNINNRELLAQLRQIEPGDWKKVYEDGYVGADRVSMHYFQSPSGKVFAVKMVAGWSNS